MNWIRTNRLPPEEPNDHNREAYSHPQLLSGASTDGRFVYDAVWVQMEECFALTLLWINEAFGFVEDERRMYPTTRAQLLAQVAQFEAAPEAAFE